MKNLTFLFVFVFIPLCFAQQADDLTQIRYKGDYVIIPENKLGEFFRNYTPKEKTSFTKSTGEIIIDGYVTDALTSEPLEGIETTFYLYDWPTPLDTLGPIYTNSSGYYSFTVVNVEEIQNITNIGFIEYYGGKAIITTNTGKKIKITTYDILGQKISTLVDNEIYGATSFDLGLKDNQPILTQIEIEGKTYTQIHIKQGNIYSVRAGKNVEQITQENNKQINKISDLGGFIDFNDLTNQHHRYYFVVGADGYIYGDTRHDMSLLPRMYLDSAFVDPNYPVIDTIKTFRDLIWDLQLIQGDWDNRQAYPPLYNFRMFVDTSNCPVEWKAPIRDAIQYWRDTMATYLGMNPDSLIVESQEFNDPTITQGFSAINIYYVNEIPNNYDSWRLVYLDGYERVFTGADISLNLSTGMQPIDVFKEINRNLEEYIVGVAYPFGRNPPGMLIDKRLRGEPYSPTENDMEFTKSIKNVQDINPATYYNKCYP